MAAYDPSYIKLYESGELQGRARDLRSRLVSCDLCPQECLVDRTRGEPGECQTGAEAEVASYGPHFGEESPLVGGGGSGTIFFARCNLACQFCQNCDISQSGRGESATAGDLARMMIELQDMGCHNINFVSPTHVVAQVVAALPKAIERGLRLPLVYNTGGYDSVDTLRLLDEVIDIYMPDMKYSDDDAALKYSGAKDYWSINTAALKEMHRQVGDLELDGSGTAMRGLLIRHLVLPGGLAGSRRVLSFIARELSTDTYINVMDQYRPCYNAHAYPELMRRPTVEEMQQVFRWAAEEGLYRLDNRPRIGR